MGRVLALLCLMTVLQGCGLFPQSTGKDCMIEEDTLFDFRVNKVALEKINFHITHNMNHDSPVLVHLLVIHDKHLLEHVSPITSTQYFAEVNQIRRANPGKFQLYEWEIHPGHTMPSMPINTEKYASVGAILFARYRAPGAHRHILGKEKEVKVELGPTDFRVVRIR